MHFKCNSIHVFFQLRFAFIYLVIFQHVFKSVFSDYNVIWSSIQEFLFMLITYKCESWVSKSYMHLLLYKFFSNKYLICKFLVYILFQVQTAEIFHYKS